MKISQQINKQNSEKFDTGTCLCVERALAFELADNAQVETACCRWDKELVGYYRIYIVELA